MIKPVYALVGDLIFATRIAKTAETMGLGARTFDRAQRVMQASKEREPSLVIMDCERLEKEAFQLLAAMRTDASLAKIPCVGYLSHTARELKQEMREAGCEQVYSRSEFTKELEQILTRYSHGIPSRI